MKTVFGGIVAALVTACSAGGATQGGATPSESKDEATPEPEPAAEADDESCGRTFADGETGKCGTGCVAIDAYVVGAKGCSDPAVVACLPFDEDGTFGETTDGPCFKNTDGRVARGSGSSFARLPGWTRCAKPDVARYDAAPRCAP